MAEQDTAIQSGQSQFPPTAWSLLERLRDPKDPRVRAYLDRMVAAYWRPVYKFVRVSWKRSNEDAKDLTQAFFIHLMEGDLLARADPERGNFRKLLLAALRNFLSNDARSGQAVKRGGGRTVVSLDVSPEESGPAADSGDPQDAFESQWAKELLERAIQRLPERCRSEAAAAFRRFHLEGASLRDLARELGGSDSQVGHWLQEARTALRRLVTDEIREYVTDDAELARELDTLFKGWR
jgi:RNA polymerase sigma-70 factor (ECF subfamily)